MLSKYQFHRNAVITGAIDSFCLVCESHLRCEEDTRSHIDKPVHRKNLDATPYFDKYKDELVRKVKRGYFCELCNLLIATAAKVGLHIVEPIHINNKGIQSLRRVGNAVLAFRDVLISESAWQGLIEDTCVLCNQEFHNESIHKTESTHILNLVQIKMEFGQGEAIFRRTDDSTFQCLTCNEMFSTDSLRSHFTQQQHLDALQLRRDSGLNYNTCENGDKEDKTNTATKTQNETFDTAAAINGNSFEVTIETSNNILGRENCPRKPVSPNISEDTNTKSDSSKSAIVTNRDTKEQSKDKNSSEKGKCNSIYNTKITNIETNEQNRDKILDNIADFQKNEITINFEIDTACCKKCFVSVPLLFEVICQHIIEHKDKPRNIGMTTPVLDENNCKIQLKNTDLDPKFDQNHNMKIKTEVELTENVGADSKLVPYIPIANTEVTVETTIKTESAETPFVETNDVALFAKQHKITYNRGNSDAFCRVCRIKVPSSLKNMKEHVFGAKHKKRISLEQNQLQSQTNKSRKKKLIKFVQDFLELSTPFGDIVVVNSKYCLSSLSFYMVTEQLGLFRCQVCELNLRKADVESHNSTEIHEDAMDETPVLMDLDNEFVREVRPGLFHCGFCNLISGNYVDLSRHLACDDHLKNKKAASERLNYCMPNIIHHQRQRRCEENIIMGMVLARFGFRF